MVPRTRSYPRCTVGQRMVVAALAALVAASAQALDLAEAYRKAEANDPNFAIHHKRREANEAEAEAARARLLPSVTFTGSMGRAETETELLSGHNRGRTTTNDYQTRNWNLSARQPLYRPGDLAGWRRAEVLVQAGDHAIAAARVKLLQQVARAYAQALTAAAQRRAAEQELGRLEVVVTQAERAFASGTATRTDIEEAQARRDAARAALWREEAKVAQALAALAALVGEAVALEALQPLSAVVPVAERALQRPLEAWIASAQSRHPEVQQLLVQEEAARLAVERARAQHLPTIDLVATRRMSRSDSETTIGQQYDTSSVAVQLQIPLYAGGGIDANVRAAVAALEEARLRTEAKRRELAQTVTQAYSGLRFALEQWRALEQAERSAQQAVIGTEKGIQAGTRHAVDLLNAQQKLAKVQADQIEVTYQIFLALLDLYGSEGEGMGLVDELMRGAVAPIARR